MVEQDRKDTISIAVGGKFSVEEAQSFLSTALKDGIAKLMIDAPAEIARNVVFMQAIVLLKREGKTISVSWRDGDPSEILQQVIK